MICSLIQLPVVPLLALPPMLLLTSTTRSAAAQFGMFTTSVHAVDNHTGQE